MPECYLVDVIWRRGRDYDVGSQLARPMVFRLVDHFGVIRAPTALSGPSAQACAERVDERRKLERQFARKVVIGGLICLGLVAWNCFEGNERDEKKTENADQFNESN